MDHKNAFREKNRYCKDANGYTDSVICTFTIVSSIFSMDPHVSWFGYYSRFNGGMWSIFCYTLLYYAYLSNKTDEKNLVRAALITASFVALYGVLERLGIDKNLWVQDVQNRVFSTLGQPNWLAAYMVALIPLSMAFALKSQNSRLLGGSPKEATKLNTQQGNKKFNWSLEFGIWSLITTLFFTTLLFTKSRSGLVGFAIADMIFWGLTIAKSRIVKPALLVHAIFAIIIFFIGTGTPALDKYITLHGLKTPLRQGFVGQEQPTGPALEVGGTESGEIRKYVWQGAFNAWKSTPKTMLIGTGTETFAFAFYQFRPVGHNLTSEWDFLYNKAHNEYLNYLATTGIFGLGSYLLFIGSFIVWFIKTQISNLNFQQGTKNNNWSLGPALPVGRFEDWDLNVALFAGWISILVTNFFGFSVVIMQIFLFLFPAIVIARSQVKLDDYTYTVPVPTWSLWIVKTGTIILCFMIGTYWYADTLYASGYRNNRAGLHAKAAPALLAATRLLPFEPSYHDELSQSYAALASAAFEQQKATQAAEFATRAIDESDIAITKSPNNVNFYKTRTKVWYTLSALNPEYNDQAIESLRRAAYLSSNDPKIYYNLAILLGRQNQTDQAITLLEQAVYLKKNYRDAYYALHVFYLEAKKIEKSKAILTEYLTQVDPSDKDFQDRVK